MSEDAGSKLRVVLLGSRGIPANYGGYETLMEELARRLGTRGVEVTVYCRSHHTPRSLARHGGAELVVLPTVRTKHLDTPVHTLVSVLHAAARQLRGRGWDAALMVNAANAVFVPILRLVGLPTALNVDGVERQRAKWGRFGRTVYRLSERLACKVPSELVTDAQVIADYYRERLGVDSTMIPYGVEPRPLPVGETLRRLGLESGRYFLYVSRFEPENNPHRVVAAYRSVRGDLPLVMVGDAPYARSFIARLRSEADPRVLFPGAIYGDGYRELLSHARAYIQATEVGGTHPALVEAMGYGNCLLVNDTPENREVAGDVALYFDAHRPETLGAHLEILGHDPAVAVRRGQAAAQRARERYSWERVCDAYLSLFEGLRRG